MLRAITNQRRAFGILPLRPEARDENFRAPSRRWAFDLRLIPVGLGLWALGILGTAAAGCSQLRRSLSHSATANKLRASNRPPVYPTEPKAQGPTSKAGRRPKALCLGPWVFSAPLQPAALSCGVRCHTAQQRTSSGRATGLRSTRRSPKPKAQRPRPAEGPRSRAQGP